MIYLWYTGGSVKNDIATIHNDTDAIARATGKNDATALTSACGSLKHDVGKFQGDPTAPDQAVRSDLSHAMSFYSSGASKCLARSYPAAGSDLLAGSQWAYQATKRIAALTGT